MNVLLYGMMAIIYSGLIIWLLQRSEPRFVWSNVLYVILCVLIYDHIVVASGKWIGEGEVLYFLNYMRFVLHACSTPLFVLYAVSILREANDAFFKRTSVFLITWLYVIVLIALEITMIVNELTLQPIVEYGILRYETAPPHYPPFMILLTTIALLICSIALWLRHQVIAMLLGVVAMMLSASIGPSAVANVVSAVMQVCFITMLVVTKRTVRQRRSG